MWFELKCVIRFGLLTLITSFALSGCYQNNKTCEKMSFYKNYFYKEILKWKESYQISQKAKQESYDCNVEWFNNTANGELTCKIRFLDKQKKKEIELIANVYKCEPLKPSFLYTEF